MFVIADIGLVACELFVRAVCYWFDCLSFLGYAVFVWLLVNFSSYVVLIWLLLNVLHYMLLD